MEIFALVFTITEFRSYNIFMFIRNIILLVKQGRSLEGGVSSVAAPGGRIPEPAKWAAKCIL